MVYIAIIGFTTIIFGVASLLLISRARNRLSEGSIRRYMDNFAICLVFIVIFSVWQTLRDFFGVSIDGKNQTTILVYPEYVFIVLAYIAFVVASLRVMKISEEFGFKEDGRKIEQLVIEKSSSSKPVKSKEKTKN